MQREEGPVDKEPLPPAAAAVKAVVIGDGSVGKTSLLISYTQGRFPHEYVPSLLESNDADVDAMGQRVRMTFFDTAGPEAYDRLRVLAYPGTDVFLVCFSVADPNSLHNVRTKWVPEARHHCPDAALLLVGTKIDLRKDPRTLEILAKHQRAPSTDKDGMAMAAKTGALSYMECSSLTQEGVKAVFETAVLCGLGQLKDPVPASSSGSKCACQ